MSLSTRGIPLLWPFLCLEGDEHPFGYSIDNPSPLGREMSKLSTCVS